MIGHEITNLAELEARWISSGDKISNHRFSSYNPNLKLFSLSPDGSKLLIEMMRDNLLLANVPPSQIKSNTESTAVSTICAM